MVTRSLSLDECRYYGEKWRRPSDVYRSFGITSPRKVKLIFAYHIPPPFGVGALVIYEDADGNMWEVNTSDIRSGWNPIPSGEEKIWQRLIHSREFDFMEEYGVLMLLDALDAHIRKQ